MKRICARTGLSFRGLRTWLLVGLGWPGALSGQIVINEILVNNQSALANGAGSYPGWVELYNPTTQPVNIASWGLTDAVGTPLKYVFPAGTTIGAKGFLLVWCDSATNTPGLHTGWSLKNGGDDVALYRTAFERIDYIAFGVQLPDVSLGRYPDGAVTLKPGIPSPPPLGANTDALPLGTIGVGGIKINEWLASASDTNNPGGEDWFELYNTNAAIVDLGGFYATSSGILTTWTDPPFPQFTFIAGNGFLRIWADKKLSPADHVNFTLQKGGGEIWFFANNKLTEIDHVTFGAQLQDISQGRLPDGTANIVSFAPVGKDTPGDSNFQFITNIVINEILAHTDMPLEDAIELHNPTAQAVNISHWWLSNSRDDPKKFRILGGTSIPAGGFKVFYETNFNQDGSGRGRSFTLNSAQGDEVYLYSASNNVSGTLLGGRVYKQFDASQNGVSLGRYVVSDGSSDFVPMSGLSFGSSVTASSPPTAQQLALFRAGTGAANPYPKVGPVIISEIMYHPADEVFGTNDNTLDEYVELCNAGTQPVNLYDDRGPFNGLYYDPDYGYYADGRTNTWRVRGSIDYNFPPNVSLGPGESLLLVNFNPSTDLTQLDAFRAKSRVPTGTKLFGPYTHKLPNGGGTVELQRPDSPQGPSHPDFRKVPYLFLEKVRYTDRAPWPPEADGLGGSLERVSLTGYANDSTNWIVNTETGPSPGRVAQFEVEAFTPKFTKILVETNKVILRFDAPQPNLTFTLLGSGWPTGPWVRFASHSPGTNTGEQELVIARAVTGMRFFRLVSPKLP